MRKNGVVFYRGPSQLDGKPIAAVATGLTLPSTNLKTGPLIQTWFIRTDMHPVEAIHRGEDFSLCGTCSHRGRIITNPETREPKNVERSCYVAVFMAPANVYRSLQKDLYPDAPPEVVRKLFARRQVRLGSYGDPACVPFEILETVLARAESVMGYTHLWKDHPELSRYCMASCDSEEERLEAKARNFRVFRVRSEADPVLRGEGICPASQEMGHAVSCSQCQLCGGQSTPAKADIVIRSHGTGSHHFERRARALAPA